MDLSASAAIANKAPPLSPSKVSCYGQELQQEEREREDLDCLTFPVACGPELTADFKHPLVFELSYFLVCLSFCTCAKF